MLHCTKSTPEMHSGAFCPSSYNYMKLGNKKYNRPLRVVLCCTATLFLSLFLPSQAGADNPKAHIKPLLQLDDAVRQMARTNDPKPLVKLLDATKSRFVREQAKSKLAGFYALNRQWDLYERHEKGAGTCARLLEALHRKEPSVISSFAKDVLDEDPTDEVCGLAMETASAAGFLRDDKIWRQIRVLVDSRKSKQANRYLRYLKEDKASATQLNNAIQNATRRIKGKHPLNTRLEQELLAVSAVVASRRNAALAGERWEKFAPHIDDDIEIHVWPIIGKHASLDHMPAKALSYFQRSPLSEHGRFELAWRARAAMRTHDWQDLKWTTDAMTGEQATLPDWRFWNAYASEKISPSEASKRAILNLALNEDSYYGLIAKSMTGITMGKVLAQPDLYAEQHLASDTDVKMAIALGVLGNTLKAREIWKFIMAGLSDGEKLAASTIAQKEGWYLGSINAADQTPPNNSNYEMRFPVPYLETVGKYARQLDIDPAFVYAIMRQESRFNPRARSSAGARGLMQVMPQTALAVARKHSYTRYRTSRLYLIDTNIIIGTRYIADLRRSLGQDPILVAATYNAGPSNVKRWLRSSKGIERMIFVETIPFTETRLYVKHVMANMAHYDLRFNSAVKPWHKWLEGRI